MSPTIKSVLGRVEKDVNAPCHRYSAIGVSWWRKTQIHHAQLWANESEMRRPSSQAGLLNG